VRSPILSAVRSPFGSAGFSLSGWAGRFASLRSDDAGNTYSGSEYTLFKSSGSFDFTPASASKRPATGGSTQNGHESAIFEEPDVIRGGSTTDWAVLSDSTLLFVLNPTSGNQGYLFDTGLGTGASNRGMSMFWSGATLTPGRLRVRYSDGGGAMLVFADAPAGSLVAGTPTVLSVGLDSSGCSVRINGAEVASDTVSDNLTIATVSQLAGIGAAPSGSSTGMKMDFFAFEAGSPRLSAADNAAAEAELATEFGISF